MNKNTSLLLLLHQPFRVTDSTQFAVNNLEELFLGKFKKPGQESSNKEIFERVAQNSYIPAAKFLLTELQKHPSFVINFTFSGTFLEQCLIYPEYGSQVIETFKQIVATGRVGIAGENYYHGVSHMYSWQEFGVQIEKQRQLIYKLFGVWPTFFRNAENKFNNDIAEFARLIGFDSVGAPGITKYINPGEIIEIKDIERPWFDREKSEAAISNNSREYIPRFMSVAPIDHQISDLVFYLREFKGDSAKENLRNIIHNNSIGFHLLFSDFEVLGEHSRNDERDALEIFSEFISICKDEEMEFVNINNIPKFANFEAKKYNVPFFVSSGNSKRNLESWRGNYLQEKAFIHLTHLHDKATKLYGRSEEKAIHILECYRKLSTSDHFYYLADIPGKDGIIHEMFSPYNSHQDAFESYKFAVDFVSNEIDKFLANDQ